MATPTNLKTGPVDIGVNAYSKPVNETAVNALGSMFESLTKIEKESKAKKFQQQERTYQAETEAQLGTTAGIFARGARLQQESLNRNLSEDEARELGEYMKAQSSREDAYLQGRKTYRAYLLDAQSRLRAAIQMRPDLADEFRKASVRELGVDVGNAAMQLWQEDMEYLKAQGKSESKYDASDVMTYAKGWQQQLKEAGSPEYESFSQVATTAMAIAFSDPTGAMAMIESAGQQVVLKDPNVKVTSEVSKSIAAIDEIDKQVTQLAALLASDANYYRNNPEAFEQLKKVYSDNRAKVLEIRSSLSGFSETHEGKRVAAELTRIDKMLDSIFKEEAITDPAVLGTKADAVIASQQYGIDSVVATQVTTATKGAPKPNVGYAHALAGAGMDAVTKMDTNAGAEPFISSSFSGRVKDSRALGSAVDALLSNAPGRMNPAGGAITMSTFSMDAPDIVNTLMNVSASGYYKYDTGQRYKDGPRAGEAIYGFMGIESFFSRGNGAVIKLASTTTATKETAGKGWLDLLLQQADPEQRKKIVFSVSMMLSGANTSLYNDILNNLPNDALKNEFQRTHYATDLALFVGNGGVLTEAPKRIERVVVNGEKVKPSPELTTAINSYFAAGGRGSLFKDGFASWDKLATFVVNSSAPAQPKPTK